MDTRKSLLGIKTHEKPMTEAPRYVSSRVGTSRAAQPLELYVSSDQERQGNALISTTKSGCLWQDMYCDSSLCQLFAQCQIRRHGNFGIVHIHHPPRASSTRNALRALLSVPSGASVDHKLQKTTSSRGMLSCAAGYIGRRAAAFCPIAVLSSCGCRYLDFRIKPC